MNALTGIVALGDYATPVSNDLKVDVLLDLLADPDSTSSSGAIAGGGLLDEMSPPAVAQLRVELTALKAGLEEGEGEGFATAEHTVTAGEASANEVVVDTGLTTAVAFTTLIVSIERAGASVKSDAVVTDNEDGTFTISEDTTYAVTAGDTVSWFAQV